MHWKCSLIKENTSGAVKLMFFLKNKLYTLLFASSLHLCIGKWMEKNNTKKFIPPKMKDFFPRQLSSRSKTISWLTWQSCPAWGRSSPSRSWWAQHKSWRKFRSPWRWWTRVPQRRWRTRPEPGNVWKQGEELKFTVQSMSLYFGKEYLN